MADLWRAYAPGARYHGTNQKSLIDVSNASTTKIVRVLRVWHFDMGTATVTGGLQQFYLTRLKGGVSVGGTNIFVRRADSNFANLPYEVSAGTDRYSEGNLNEDILRRYTRSTDEWAPTEVANLDHWELEVPFALIWNAGYTDSNVEPLVVRRGEAIHVRQDGTASTTSPGDMEIEFTIGDT